MDRRDFLRGSAGVCGLTLLGLGLASTSAGANNQSRNLAARGFGAQAVGITRQKNGTVVVDTKKVRSLNRVGGVVALGTVKGVPAAMVRTSSSTFVALDLRCTHAGVTVRQAGNEWRCPAHGSVFKEDGAFVEGPAGAPLLKLQTRRRGNLITVG
jgi:Rieske Fe-S protein